MFQSINSAMDIAMEKDPTTGTTYNTSSYIMKLNTLIDLVRRTGILLYYISCDTVACPLI